MEVTIKRWRLEAQGSGDFRTVQLLIETDQQEIEEKIVTINLTGSVMTQIGDYVDAQYHSADFPKQMGRLAAALLKRELEFSPRLIHKPDLKFGYLSETFPFGSVYIPDIDDPEGWKFTV